VLAACLLLAAGCAKPPPPGVPLTHDELETLASSLAEDAGELAGLRASGAGGVTFGARGFEFAFAAVYDNPGWFRADLRPKLGSLSSTMTALVLWDGGCARAYLPARAVEVRGCLAGPGEAHADVDYAAAFLGRLDARVVAGLEDAEISVAEGTTVVRGVYRGIDVELSLGGDPARMTGLRLTEPGGVLELDYEGHGWTSVDWLPETVEARLTRGGREVLATSFVYRTARPAEEIDRDDFTFKVPPDVEIIGWEELGLWRSE
jgi:hypothetical protein